MCGTISMNPIRYIFHLFLNPYTVTRSLTSRLLIQVTLREIKGEIIDIERVNGKSEVIVEDASAVSAYSLSEEFIQFCDALDAQDLGLCTKILESTQPSTQLQAMWNQLLDASLKHSKLAVAERCASALRNVSLAKFIRNLSKLADSSNGNGSENDWKIHAKLCELKRDVEGAESIYLAQNRVEEVILMYENLDMYSDVIRVLEKVKDSNIQSKRDLYCDSLIDSNRQDKAAEIRESEGDFVQSITLYLHGGFPERAANLCFRHGIMQPPRLLESVALTLDDAGLFKVSGDLYDHIGSHQKAIGSYTRANSFDKAVVIARRHAPDQVASLEEIWADYCFQLCQYELAIDHYWQGHSVAKALKVSMKAQLWTRAVEIALAIEDEGSYSMIRELAQTLSTLQRYDTASELYTKIQDYKSLVTMYLHCEKWAEADIVSKTCGEEEKGEAYLEAGLFFEDSERFVNAESLYLTAKAPMKAIAMYKKQNRYEDLHRLITEYRPDLLAETNAFIARRLENTKSHDAEKIYAKIGDWLGAVNMYRREDKWEDALRVAKSIGGPDALKKVAYVFAMHLGVDQSEELVKLKVLDDAIQYSVENNDLQNAIALSKSFKSDDFVRGLILKQAQVLEDEEDAERVADTYERTRLRDVKIADANHAISNGDVKIAEDIFIHIGEPEMAVSMFASRNMFDDALRVANNFVPHQCEELKKSLERQEGNQHVSSLGDCIRSIKSLEGNGRNEEAINACMNINRKDFFNHDDILKLWEYAFDLAREKSPHMVESIAMDIASRQDTVGFEEEAAELLYQHDALDSAVGILIKAKQWESARSYAQTRPDLLNHVSTSYQQHLQQNGNVSDLIEMGKIRPALDILVKEGKWDEVWSMILQKHSGTNDFSEYTVIRLKQLFEGSNSIVDAIKLLSDKKAPLPDCQIHWSLYLKITHGLLAFSETNAERVEYLTLINTLKNIIKEVIGQCQPDDGKADTREHVAIMNHLLMTTHYTRTMLLCSQHHLSEIACKCSITLLKYSVITFENGKSLNLIPPDKAFYGAGFLCRDAGHESLAFIFLNRYIDCVEVSF